MPHTESKVTFRYRRRRKNTMSNTKFCVWYRPHCTTFHWRCCCVVFVHSFALYLTLFTVVALVDCDAIEICCCGEDGDVYSTSSSSSSGGSDGNTGGKSNVGIVVRTLKSQLWMLCISVEIWLFERSDVSNKKHNYFFSILNFSSKRNLSFSIVYR